MLGTVTVQGHQLKTDKITTTIIIWAPQESPEAPAYQGHEEDLAEGDHAQDVPRVKFDQRNQEPGSPPRVASSGLFKKEAQ